MRLFKKFEEKGISPVIGVILLVAIVVILAAVTGFFLLGGFNNQEASFSGVETSESEFRVVTMQSAERLIFKRSDGKLYYADQAGEKITPKGGEYTVIAQSGDGSKNVIKTNIQAYNKASITIDSFDNSKSKPVLASNNVENDLKLVNLNKNKLIQGRYTSPIKTMKMEKINNITIETGSSQASGTVQLVVLTNFNSKEDTAGNQLYEASVYKAVASFSNSAGETKKNYQLAKDGFKELDDLPNGFFPYTVYGSQFKNEIKNGKHKNSIMVRVSTFDEENIDIERITVNGEKKADAFDTPRPLSAPKQSAKIVSTNSPFNESEGDSEREVTGKVANMKGNFSITFLPPEEERPDPLPLAPAASAEPVSVDIGEEKTINTDYPSPRCEGTQEFSLVEVEKKTIEDRIGGGSEKRWVVTDIKDSVSYTIENVSGDCSLPPR